MCRRVRRRSGRALAGVNPRPFLHSHVTDNTSLASEGVDSLEATLDYTPDGAPCAVCGETVARRWRDDAGYVCPDCTEW